MMLLAKITAIPFPRRAQASLIVPGIILGCNVKDKYSGAFVG